jgi:hypothetical protein
MCNEAVNIKLNFDLGHLAHRGISGRGIGNPTNQNLDR